MNILANLKKQLGICHYQMGQFQEAVSEFEDGIKAILLLDNFEEFELAQYYYFTADIYLEMGNA